MVSGIKEADAYWGQGKMETELKLWVWDRDRGNWRDDSASSEPGPLPPLWAAASFILLGPKGGKFPHLGWKSCGGGGGAGVGD